MKRTLLIETVSKRIQISFIITLAVTGYAALSSAATAATSPTLTLKNLTCLGLVNPQGLDASHPGLSWISASTDPAARGQIQTAYQILVADSEAALGRNTGNLWDSGKVLSDQSTHVAYAGMPLPSHQACYWKVRVWNRDGAESAWSQPGFWTMGFVAPDKWQPNWIGNQERTPLLRKEFKVVQPVKRAWVYASALGLYELRMNGSKVGNDLFAPGWTDYRQRVQYRRYEVTNQVKNGDNVIGAEIAPGWFAGKIAWFSNNRYGKQVSFSAELHLEFADGSTEVVATDGTWKTSAGPLTASDIQDGDQYDARLEKNGWDKPGYNDSKWTAAEVRTGENRNLVAQQDEPVGVVREMTPVKVTEPAPGIFVYDLGQNITGVARIAVKGAKGTTITLKFAERLNANGTLDVTNLKESKATDTYITSGNGIEIFQPKFTFHGFRWISIEGLEKAPALADVTGVVVGSRFPEIGSLQTSNPDLNHLLSNIRWTVHNSYLSVPLDSPQRSERLGWTGDANVMAATATWFFGLDRFYSKWERDILDAQAYNKDKMDGGMPNVAPRWAPKQGGTGGGWGDVGVNLPYVLWQRYGDTDIIRTSYVGMKKWIAYMERASNHHIIPVKARISTAGDWENANDETPKDLIGTFYYALDVAQLAEMAAAIGEDADAAAFRKRFQEVRAAIIKAFIAPDGKVAKGSQTAQVFALYLGLYPDGMREKIFGKLLENIRAHDDHLTTGYLGSQWLLHVLVANGRADVAYKILLQKTGPSWLFMASNGQTSLWEGWNSLNPDGTFGPTKRTSLGHSALGSCGDWMFQNIGGLVPDPASPGFKHFIIRPIPGGALTNAELKYESPQGRITSRWTLKDVHFNLEVDVPVNATATIVLPTAGTANITESGRPVAASPGVIRIGTTNGFASYNVGSGRYTFAATLTEPPQP
jgi:alpha-L-rhamnosidase